MTEKKGKQNQNTLIRTEAQLINTITIYLEYTQKPLQLLLFSYSDLYWKQLLII